MEFKSGQYASSLINVCTCLAGKTSIPCSHVDHTRHSSIQPEQRFSSPFGQTFSQPRSTYFYVYYTRYSCCQQQTGLSAPCQLPENTDSSILFTEENCLLWMCHQTALYYSSIELSQ
jgi:hypothetical protein